MRATLKAFALFLLAAFLYVPSSLSAPSPLEEAKRLNAQVILLYRADKYASKYIQM